MVKWTEKVDGVTTHYNKVLPLKWSRGKKFMYPLAGDVQNMSKKYADLSVKDSSPIDPTYTSPECMTYELASTFLNVGTTAAEASEEEEPNST